jgi:hypothetical protein
MGGRSGPGIFDRARAPGKRSASTPEAVPCSQTRFPIGLRWLRSMNRDAFLHWMWTLNGGASLVATVVAFSRCSSQLTLASRSVGIRYLVAASVIALLQFPAPVYRST